MKKEDIHRQFKLASGSISSIPNLANALGLTTDDFERLWEIPETDRYTVSERPKLSGGVRVVHNPCRPLRIIQRRLNTRVFSNPYVLTWHPFLFGSIPKTYDADSTPQSRDYIACAQRHCGAKSLLKMDIENFFDNIHEDLVIKVFKEVLSYPDDVSEILTRICTYNSSLVQGALTSSYIAMLSLYKEEVFVVEKLRRKGLVYTRFVDDITVSSKMSGYNFSYASNLIEQMLTNAGLPLNASKTIVQTSSSLPLSVHGLRINFSQPRLPAEEPRRIRASVKNMEIVAQEPDYRKSYAYRKDYNRCMGRVNKLGRVGHSQHKKLVRRLAKIRPLPSRREVEYVKRALVILQGNYEESKDMFWYKRHYHRVAQRLNLIKKSYPDLASSVRNELRKIRPEFE